MKIAHLFSGGVDSSVALWLLREAGHDIVAVYLKIWREDELSFGDSCPWEEDLAIIEKTCTQLQVPFITLSLQREYHDLVVSEMLQEIAKGKTPNPDVWCNSRIKFQAAAEKIARELPDRTHLSTGHYAQIQRISGKNFLVSGVDLRKDQAYFLSRLSEQQLQKALFPLGALHKTEVRQIAQQVGLPAALRPESQGICFLGKFHFSDFLRKTRGECPGEIFEEETHEFLGMHPGFWFFTIGQRTGLRLSGGPWFVIHKDIAKNHIFVSKKPAPERAVSHCIVEDLLFSEEPSPEKTLLVKIRHGPAFLPADWHRLSEQKGVLTFPEKAVGIAPGQYAVLFDTAHRVLGSGVISEEPAATFL